MHFQNTKDFDTCDLNVSELRSMAAVLKPCVRKSGLNPEPEELGEILLHPKNFRAHGFGFRKFRSPRVTDLLAASTVGLEHSTKSTT